MSNRPQKIPAPHSRFSSYERSRQISAKTPWILLTIGLVTYVVVIFFCIESSTSVGKTRTNSLFHTLSHKIDIPFLPSPKSHQDYSDIRLFQNNGDTPTPLTNGTTVYKGDEVQIQYRTTKNYGVIFSVDGLGIVSLHFPDTPQQSARIRPGAHLLPFAFKLDDAPGFETFFLITSDEPIHADRLVAAGKHVIHADDPITIPYKRAKVTSVILHKEIRN